MPDQPVFYYDLASPACYLLAEQIVGGLPGAEWEPLLATQLAGSEVQPERSSLERRAVELGLQPLRWPRQWPPDTRLAMLAATYAKGAGRTVAFSLAAFRQAFAAGRDLGEQDTVLLAGAACEMHPGAVLKGVSLKSVARALDRAGERARSSGVRSIPAITVGGSTFEGLDAIEQAMSAVDGR
ncbi:MAG: DsbA family protein [Actinomycetota bacterium]|nr:DsbA family protein [Actinomycetota bacterium]